MRRRRRHSQQDQLIPSHLKIAFSVVEAAEMMSMGVTKVRDLIKDHRLLVVREGRSIVVPLTEMQAFLERNKS